MDSSVYFLHAPAVNLIKIGRSVFIERRLGEIRLISPVPLELIGFVPGGSAVEAEYHQRWARLRSHGEWFHGTEELFQALNYDSLVASWNRAGKEARQWFLETINAPIMDERYAAQIAAGKENHG